MHDHQVAEMLAAIPHHHEHVQNFRTVRADSSEVAATETP
jgi:hypothetical protein